MRFNVEFSGVIDAENEIQANDLAARIASDTRQAYQFPCADGFPPSAVVARMDVEVVVPKTREVAA